MVWKERRVEAPRPGIIRFGFDYRLEPENLTLEPAGGFTRVAFRGGHQAGLPGAPQLPFLMVHVAIPEGAKLAGVQVQQLEQKGLEGTHAVMPAQLPGIAELRFRPDQLRQRYASLLQQKAQPLAEVRKAFVEPNKKLYQLQSPFPAAVAEVVSQQSVGPYQVVAIRVNPVQYVPARGALLANAAFTLTVDTIRTLQSEPERSRYTREQLELAYEIASRLVLNPGILRLPEGFKAPGSQFPYVILTNKAMRAEFDRLAEWKTACGLGARVVTKEDVLAKVYGDFAVVGGVPARDEQETLRNFLKWACRKWGICYLVIGGDTDVIPVREVAALSHYNTYERQNQAAPDEDKCVYNTVKKQAHIRMAAAIATTTPLLAASSGVRIPYNPTASAITPGWYFAADASYAAASASPTKYVVVKGPAGLVDDARGFYRIDATYSIPTDLYYASLDSARYGKAGKHDWDALDQGLYGYYSETGEPSGIDFRFDVCAGRLPCANAAEAKAVVDKLLRYERFEGIDALATRKAIFAADYWGAPVVCFAAPAGTALGDNQYRLTGSTTCRLLLKETPAANVDLIADDGAGIYRQIPYRADADATHPGWYFATGPVSTTASHFPLFGIDLPIPTRYIVVRGPAGTLSPSAYWVDNAAADGALVEKEQARQLFRAQAPQVDLHARLYRDFASTPAAAAGDSVTTDVLDTTSLTTEWNKGALFVSLSGHGWPGGCCTVGRTEADAFTNSMNLPVVVADSCSTANFQENDAFGEKLLLNPNGGAIAYLGNTRYSWIGMGDDVERLFWDALFVGGHTASLGTGFGARFATLTSGTGWILLWKWIVLAQNLLGDPSLKPWAGVPQRMSLALPAKATPLSNLTVTVADADGAPVALARVVAYQAGRMVRAAYTDAAGKATVSLSGSVRGAVTITAVKPGAVPVQKTINLV
ncbi:MAG TPA: C25 family cysteine peptidase [Symbiobacteriaceae bacterium]|nr:C25 family cysteine peptidase [Symbiobacteriaceae bacterium]